MDNPELTILGGSRRKIAEIRHSCEQGDGLAGYTFTEHDLRDGAIQVLKDPKNNLELTTEFLKFPGGEHGGSWAARINGRPLDPSQSLSSLHTAF